MLTARHLRRPGRLAFSQLASSPSTTLIAPLSTPLSDLSHTFATTSFTSSSHQTWPSSLSRYCISDPKGKGRELDVASSFLVTRSSPSNAGPSSMVGRYRPLSSPVIRRSTRTFHATARRDAIPLLPATIAILKGTSVLTLATAVSRIVISFLPIGTIATVKMMRIGRVIDSDSVKPSVGPEAEEFWKMWCEGEKGENITKQDSMRLTDANMNEDCCLIAEDGRIAYHVRMLAVDSQRNGTREDWLSKPVKASDLVGRKGWKKSTTARMIQRHYYYLPPLPPASESYYNALEPAQRSQVDALRRYWIGIQMFKRYFKAWHIALFVLFGTPIVLLFAVYIAGMERVPLTGRWRLILLTPEEEDAISTSLSGPNWYRSVINLLTTPERPAPPILPENDWRWYWVQGVLNRLERATLANYGPSANDNPSQPQYAPSIPIPPAPYHPLIPRPRVSSMLHSALPGGEPSSGREHLEIGPPYNLMLMEKDERNAFSYGFGGKRAGGIVVFTGLLDSILRDSQVTEATSPQQPTRTGLFSGLFSSSAPPPQRVQPQPTEEQTLHLACVLAHEMGHLLLSHHLETLSQQQVLWPSMLGLSMDLIRAFIWPITWILGPAINDALANMGKTSTEELANRYGEIGFQFKHEYEADLAGMRILALSGFDPALAVDYLTKSVAELHEIQPMDKKNADSSGLTSRLFKLWTEATHPSPEHRREAVRTELKRWQVEAERLEQSATK